MHKSPEYESQEPTVHLLGAKGRQRNRATRQPGLLGQLLEGRTRMHVNPMDANRDEGRMSGAKLQIEGLQ
jgi:hypothetical protein